jgi:hypothetical protein
VKSRILIVIGALAAIADEPGMWDIPADQGLPAGTLDDQHTELHYLVHVEWHGDTNISGYASATLEVTGRTATAQPYNVMMYGTNLAEPDVTRATAAPIIVGETTSADVDLAAWHDCASDPCSADYELVLARPAVPGMIVDVGGSFHIDIEGTGEQPTGTQVSITVTTP